MGSEMCIRDRLEPLLFLIYINDMPLTVESILAFCLLMTRSCIATILQNNLDKLVLWEENWSIEVHPKISKVLRITNKRKPINAAYKIHNKKLEIANNAKYLGVTINKHLSWKDHVNSIVSKATNVRHFLQRNFMSSTKLNATKHSLDQYWSTPAQYLSLIHI